MPTKKKAAPGRTTKTKAPPAKSRTMSDSHKTAIASARAENKAVSDYLDALESNKPKRGRKRTPESIAARLAAIDTDLASVTAIRRLELIQEQINLNNELAALEAGGPDTAALEAAFIAHAKAYAERKGISRAAWRAMDVEPKVLKAAGI